MKRNIDDATTDLQHHNTVFSTKLMTMTKSVCASMRSPTTTEKNRITIPSAFYFYITNKRHQPTE